MTLFIHLTANKQKTNQGSGNATVILLIFAVVDARMNNSTCFTYAIASIYRASKSENSFFFSKIQMEHL